MLKKHTYKTHISKHTHNPFLLKITFKSNNFHSNHHILTIFTNNHYTNIMRTNIFLWPAINKYKAKIYDQCMYTLIIIIFLKLFSFTVLRMNGESINVNEKTKKASFTTKVKKYLI